jgi:hypothetical protein
MYCMDRVGEKPLTERYAPLTPRDKTGFQDLPLFPVACGLFLERLPHGGRNQCA